MPPPTFLIAHSGFWANLWEVLYPLSSRPTDGFEEALKAGGAMREFPPLRANAASATSRAGGGADGAADDGEDDDDDGDDDFDDEEIDSDDPNTLPAVSGKQHAQ